MVNRRLTHKDVKRDIWLELEYQIRGLVETAKRMQKESVFNEKETKKKPKT